MNARTRIDAGAAETPAGGAPVELIDQELRAGVLRMRLRHAGEAPPPVALTHRTVPVPCDIEADGQPGVWRLSAVLPAAALCEGVQTLLATMPDGTAIGAAQMVLGRPAEESVEARLDLMRQEIDLLKKVVRRQARERRG